MKARVGWEESRPTGKPSSRGLLCTRIYYTSAGGPAPPRILSTEEWGARSAADLSDLELEMLEILEKAGWLLERDCIPTRLK